VYQVQEVYLREFLVAKRSRRYKVGQSHRLTGGELLFSVYDYVSLADGIAWFQLRPVLDLDETRPLRLSIVN
jgi:hypothetical protein